MPTSSQLYKIAESAAKAENFEKFRGTPEFQKKLDDFVKELGEYVNFGTQSQKKRQVAVRIPDNQPLPPEFQKAISDLERVRNVTIDKNW